MTPEGVLYEREVILENLVSQKKACAQKQAAYAAQSGCEAVAASQAAAADQQARLDAFHRLNHGGGDAGARKGDAQARSAHSAQLKAFWMPGQTPDTPHLLAPPSSHTLCPATGNKLRLKDLVGVKFTRVPGEQEQGVGRFMCPLCQETFTNVSRIVVLKPTGQALSEDCYRRFVEPEGQHEGVKVRAKDVVRLERGGTGFAATSQVEAKTYTLLGIGSGLSDNRGQHAGGRSRFAGMRLR